jgi:iron complex transport system substrate-binding protein
VLLVALAAALPTTASADDRGGIVAIGGAVTEIVFALGAGDRLVAVDSTSQYPPAATELPDVGYMRQLAAEPILSMEPATILAVADAGPKRVLHQIRQAGVPITTIPDAPSPDGVVTKIRRVAEAIGRTDAAEDLIARVKGGFARVKARTADLSERPSVLFLLSAGKGPPLVAGRDTSAARIIDLAGGRNAITSFDGFKPLSPEAAVAAAPEVILTTTGTRDALGGAKQLLSRPALTATPAGENGRLIAMDGLLLLGFGPRTPEAANKLAEALHPEAALATDAE